MSNIYIQEPPTNGKVLLKTSNGDVDIELWTKEAPKACRNFIQLCLEGYYDNSIFHRIIKGFIVQGGDPTGTGEGGQSIYGEAFKDEFHSRLKFSRRGLVAMANAGPNDNASQFFFTLDRCEHLNNKHTIFGKVVGNTVFNMLKLGEVETDGEDRPIYPPKIKSTEVLANPFDDIVPRDTKKNKDEKKKKTKVKGTKNFSLLSFGEEAEEDEVETQQASKKMRNKSKSAHDLTRDRSLSSAPAIPKSPPQDSNKRKRSFSGEEGALSSPEGKQLSGTDAGQFVKKLKGDEDEDDTEKAGGINTDGERIAPDIKNSDSETTSKEEAVKSDEVNKISDRKSRWDKIPENMPPEPPVAKPDKKDRLSDGVGKKSSPDGDKVAEKSEKKVRDSERAPEKKDPERTAEKLSDRNVNRDSHSEGGERKERTNRDTERGSKRDEAGRTERDRGKRDSERYEKRDNRDLEKLSERKQSRSPTRRQRDSERTQRKQSKSPLRSDNRKDGGRDGARTESKRLKSPTRSDNRKDSGRDGVRTGRMEKEEKKESGDGKDADKGGKSKGENEDSRRSRSSSNSSTKKDSDRGSSDKSSRKDRSGSEEKSSSQNGGSKMRERRPSQDEKEHKLSRKEQIRRELENLDRELQETRRKRNEKRKLEKPGDIVENEKEVPPPVEPAPVEEDTESSAMINKEPKATDALDEFHDQKNKFKQLKKRQVKGSSREAQTLALLAKFQKKLHSAILEKPEEKEQGEVVEDEEEETQENKEEDEAGLNWAVHSLHFEDHGPALAKDANIEGADTFDIFDPRNPMTKRRREESKRKTREERKGRR